MEERWLFVLVPLRVVALVILWPAVTLLATGCGFVPSDPEPPVFGARAEQGEILIKIPLCSSDTVRRVEVTDYDDTKHSSPRLVWWASDPNGTTTKQGKFTLWSGSGFQHSASKPTASAIPRNIDVGYVDPSGDGRDDVFNLTKIARANLKQDQYWTANGPKTASQIDAQLSCGRGRAKKS
jgi:hypothetical protein